MERLVLLMLSLIALSFLYMGYVSADCISSPSGYSFKCGDKINESCVMNKDETTTTSCFTVDASNIVIDCNGYSITGDDPSTQEDGFEVSKGVNNVTIKNCDVSHFYYAFYLSQTYNFTLINNIIHDNVDTGIFVTEGNSMNLTNNTAHDNRRNGFYLYNSSNNTLINNSAYENADADFILAYTSNCRLINNTAHNSKRGFYLSDTGASDYNVLENNIAYNETVNAFSIARGSNNNLTNNIAYNSNVGFGLYKGPTTNNRLVGNVAHDNDGDGFVLSSSGLSGRVDNNTLFNNTAYNNYDGFYIEGGGGLSNNNNNLTNNIAHDNDQNGFLVMWPKSQYTHLENNLAYNNSQVKDPPSGGIVITMCSNTVMINNTAQGNLGGIALTFAENVTLINNTMNNNNFYNFALWGDTDAQHNHTIQSNNLAAGKPIFYLKNGNNMSTTIMDPATFYCIWCDGYNLLNNLNISHQAFGVYFWNSHNSGVENITGTYTYNLIRLANSSNNVFSNVVMGDNYDYDFESTIGFSNWTVYLERDALNNTFNNFNFNGVMTDFVASDVIMRKVGNTAAPSGYNLIDKNIEAEDNSGSGSGTPYLFLNISYDDSDIAGLQESSLFIARNNGTWELNSSAFANPYGLNAADNYVYANITGFGSSFGIVGRTAEEEEGGGGGGSSYIPPVCGDNTCDQRRESYLTCPEDCEAPVEPQGNISRDCGDLNVRGCQTSAGSRDIIKFIVKGQEHLLQINSMTDNSIDIWIWSNPAHYTITIGETKQFDLDKNGYNDFALTLNSIVEGKVDLLLTALKEAIPSEKTEETVEQPPKEITYKAWAWWPYVLLIALVIVVVITIIKQREKRLRHLGYK